MDPVAEFVTRQRELLRLERAAEVDEARRLQETLPAGELERQGIALLRLRVADTSAGFGGRTLLDLEPTRGGDLPAHRFQPGDIVLVRSQNATRRAREEDACTGVVVRRRSGRLTLALDELPDDGLDEPLRVDRVANDVTYRRQDAALTWLASSARGPAKRLREVLFGLRDPRVVEPKPLEPLDAGLDASQREAVALALEAPDIALIHGPPGTGKTTAVTELVRQAVRRGERVLACAPSNIAVDNLVERLAAAGVRVVRLGHPARLLPAVVEHSLEAIVERSDRARIAVDVRRELEATVRKLRKASDRATRRETRDLVRRLGAELRDVERAAVRDTIACAEVVLATNIGAASGALAEEEFDLVVIDEAAQALEAACWVPLLRGRRAVLAGDHLQLPPTICSRDAERGGLGVTLFDRLQRAHGGTCSRMLTTQYRMNETIMAWASNALYGGRLEAHASVKGHVLADLEHVETSELTTAPLIFVDTAGCDFEETPEEQGDSRANEREADLVVAHVERLTAAGVRPEEIAVISPYNAQVDTLRHRLGETMPAVEVDSVDGFQGREKEAVVISLVRSNPDGEVGFLSDDRRMNVAVTRARRQCAIFGDSATVSRHPFLEGLVAYCEKQGDYRSAWELL